MTTGQQSAEEEVSGWRHSLIAFQVANFRWLFAGRVTSNMARQMRVFLRAWMVLELTDSPLLMGLVVSSLSWPMLVLPFVGGVMADRFDRKRLLQWTESLLTVLWFVVAFSVLLGAKDIGPEVLQVQWWHFIITSFISGVIQSIGRPGHQAMIGSVMDSRRLPSAVALDSIADTWPRIGGPAFAALAIWLVGGPWQQWGPWLFFFTSAAQLFTAITIFAMKWQPGMDVSKTRKKTSAWRDFVEGLALIRNNAVLISLVALGFAFMLFAGGASFLLPVFARDVLSGGGDDGAAAFGLLSTAQTIGASLGALVNVALANFSSRGKLLLGVGLGHAFALVAFSQSTILYLSVGLILMSSGSGVFFRTSQRMLLQRFAPNDARGRVMAMDVFQQGLSPIGVLIWGVIAEIFQARYGIADGTQLTWMLGGIMYAMIIILFFAFVPALRSFRIGQIQVPPLAMRDEPAAGPVAPTPEAAPAARQP